MDENRFGNSCEQWEKTRLCLKRRAKANLEAGFISDGLHERDWIGGYAEALPKYLSYLLDLLFNLRPRLARFPDISYYARPFCQLTKDQPCSTSFSVPAIGKA